MARIFVAIRLDDETKQQLLALQRALKERGVGGRYCPYGNMHMTMAFVGEKYDLQAVREAVGEVIFESFCMTLGEMGTFGTKDGVIWCGVREKETVTSIAMRVRERLSAHGVTYSKTAFYPHISLVQHPTSMVTDIEVPKATICVDKLYVMMSERIDGVLTYHEI